MLVLPSIWRRSLWCAVEWALLWVLCLALLPTLAHAQVGACALPGDVDQNGTVTPLDALMALQHYWIPTLNAERQDCANVLNRTSSAITPADALCIFRRALGQPSCLDEMIPNRPPTLTDPGLQNTVESGGVVLPITATDPDGDPLSYSASMLPPGLAIDPATGRITGNLDATAVVGNSYTATVTVSDGTLSAQATFTWLIARAQISAGPCLCAGEPGDVIDISAVVRPATEDNLLRRPGSQQLVRVVQNATAEMTCEFGVPVTFTLEEIQGEVLGEREGGFRAPNGDVVSTITACPDATGIATVPYIVGANRVRVVQAGLAGSQEPPPVRFTVSLGFPSGIVVGADQRLLVTDAGRRTIVRLNPANNEQTIVSGCLNTDCSATIGNGPPLFFPRALALDPTGATLIVLDLGEGLLFPHLLGVNLETGDRFIISSNSNEDDVFFGSPVGVVVRSDGAIFVLDQSAFIVDFFGFFRPSQAVLQVDVATGDRQVISSNFNLDDVFFGSPVGIAVEPSGSLVIVDSLAYDSNFIFSPAVLRINPARGSDRQIVSSNFSRNNVFFGSPRAIAVDTSGETPVLVVVDAIARDFTDFFTPGVIRIDPVTGMAIEGIDIPSNFTPQTDVLFLAPSGVAVGVDGTLFVVDVGDFSTALPRVIVIAPDGSRRVIGGDNDRRGTGERFVTPQDVAVQTNDGTLWVLDLGLDTRGRANPRVVHVNSVTGNRIVVSSNNVPDDVFFGVPLGIVVAADGSNLWVLDRDIDSFGNTINPRIVSVNPRTGDRTVVSSNFNNDDVFFGLPVDIAIDSNGTLWVLDAAANANGFFSIAILQVSPVNGDRTVVAFNSQPATAFFGFPVGIAVTPDGNTVWIADSNALDFLGQPLFGVNNSSVVWHVNPRTGVREVRASNNDFSAALFGPLMDIVVEPDGNLLVLDTSSRDFFFTLRSPAIWRVSPSNGLRQLVSSNRFPSLGFLAQPFGIALEDANHLVEVDQLLGAVVRVELSGCSRFSLSCGERTIVSR